MPRDKINCTSLQNSSLLSSMVVNLQKASQPKEKKYEWLNL